MKHILLLAAGAIGAAGLITMAAPASAEGDNGATQTRQFQQNLQSQSKVFADSIDPGNAVNEFLNGNCSDYPTACPKEDMNPGVLHQFEEFRRSLQSQSTTFGDSIDPTKQMDKFVKSITAPSDDPA